MEKNTSTFLPSFRYFYVGKNKSAKWTIDVSFDDFELIFNNEIKIIQRWRS